LLQGAFSAFFGDSKKYLLILAVPALLTFITAFFEPNVFAENAIVDSMDQVLYLATILVALVASMFMTIALVHAIADPMLSVKDAYKKAQAHFFKYLLFTLVLTLILFVGFVLLIIPGIYLSVLFAFALFYLLLEHKSIKESLTASKELVKGRWWKVALRVLVLLIAVILVSMLIEFVSGILSVPLGEQFAYAFSAAVSLIMTPVSTLFMYELYKDLRGTSSLSTENVVQSVTATSI
jgi:hypothetical protein